MSGQTRADRHIRKRAPGLAPALLISAGLITSSTVAQQPPAPVPTEAMKPPTEPTPPELVLMPEITLAEAVRLTLLYSPDVQLAKQGVAEAMGAFQQEAGAFDHVFEAAPAYTHTKAEILPVLRKREKDKRDRLQALAEGFGEMAEELRKALEESRNPPPCPEGVDLEEVVVVTGLENVVNVNEICVPRDLSTTRKILEAIGQADRFNLGETISDLVQRQREQLGLRREIAETISTKAQLARERQGVMPEDEVVKNLSFDLAYLVPFRSGLSLRGDLRLQSKEDNFRDKPLDPSFGGLGAPNRFPSFFELSLDVPLGKGRGRVSAAAPEKAAAENVEAQRESLRHTISEAVFGTVLAYVNLLAAQEELRLLEESAEINRRFVELTRQLIEANEVARMELSRAQARAAAVEDAAAAARVSVLEARFALAQAMGLEVESLRNAPLASDVLPRELAAEWDRKAMAEHAVAGRRDLKAVERLKDAAQVLAEAAKSDLKRRVDFSVSAGMTTFYESPFFRFLPDELEESPAHTPLHFYSPRGYWRAIQGNWKPFFMAELVFDVPFKNSEAKGRLLQESSSFARTEIEMADLERTIVENVVRLIGALERAAEAVDRRRGSIDYFQQTLDAALERYQAGDITLLDTLITEEDLTREKLAWVQAMQVYLSLLARLKFEVADLVRFRQEGTLSESVELVLGDLVAAEQGE